MLTTNDVNILRSTFKNQILNFTNNRIKKMESDFGREQTASGKQKIKWRLKELHKIKSYIHTI